MPIFHGTAGPDVIVGTLGDDIVENIGVGADVVNTLAGNDQVTVIPEVGSLAALVPAIVNLGTGYDRLVIDYSTSNLAFAMSSPVLDVSVGFGGSIAVLGTNALVYTGADAFTVLGGSQGDAIFGNANADFLSGGGGADVLTGGGGADVFSYGLVSDSTPIAPDQITDFQTGLDKIDLSAVAHGVVNLVYDGAGSTAVYYDPIQVGEAGGGIQVVGVVQASDLVVDPGTLMILTGSPAADTLVGTSGNDVISAGQGDDLILGGGGADTLTGGGGADTFRYTAVSDSTPDAPDTITDFQTGSDKIDLSAVAHGVVNLVYDGAGSTALYYDPLQVGLAGGGVLASGVVQASDLIVDAGTQFIFTESSASDTLQGTAGADVIQGQGGADVIIGGGGADILSGGAGADIFRYTAVSDSTTAAFDTITDFQHGSDKIDLSGVAGGAVNLVYDGHGTTFLYYAPYDGVHVSSALAVVGDVEVSDIIADPGTNFILTGSFSGPEAHSASALGGGYASTHDLLA